MIFVNLVTVNNYFNGFNYPKKDKIFQNFFGVHMAAIQPLLLTLPTTETPVIEQKKQVSPTDDTFYQTPLLNNLPPDAITSMLKNLTFEDWTVLSRVSHYWYKELNIFTQKFIETIVEKQDPQVREEFLAFLHCYDPKTATYSPMTITRRHLLEELRQLQEKQQTLTVQEVENQAQLDPLLSIQGQRSQLQLIEFIANQMSVEKPEDYLLNFYYVLSKIHQSRFSAANALQGPWFIEALEFLKTLPSVNLLKHILEESSLLKLPQIPILLDKLQILCNSLNKEDMQPLDAKISNVFRSLFQKTSLSLKNKVDITHIEKISFAVFSYLSCLPSFPRLLDNFNEHLDSIISELSGKHISVLEQNKIIKTRISEFLHIEAIETLLNNTKDELKDYGPLLVIRCLFPCYKISLQQLKITEQCPNLMKLIQLAENFSLNPKYVKFLNMEESIKEGLFEFIKIWKEPEMREKKFYIELEKLLNEPGLIEFIEKILPKEYLDIEHAKTTLKHNFEEHSVETLLFIPNLQRIFVKFLVLLQHFNQQNEEIQSMMDLKACFKLLPNVHLQENDELIFSTPGFHHGLIGNLDAVNELIIRDGMRLPPQLSLLRNLEILKLENPNLTFLLAFINRLTNLKQLIIRDCPKLTKVHPDLLSSTNLVIKVAADTIVRGPAKARPAKSRRETISKMRREMICYLLLPITTIVFCFGILIYPRFREK